MLSDLSLVLREDYIHVGGDEVVYGCWFADPAISSWASQVLFLFPVLMSYDLISCDFFPEWLYDWGSNLSIF